MKKIMSLLLSLTMILSAAGMITAGAAEVTTSFKDDTSFYFSFENESDFDHPDMVLDTIGLPTFKTPGVSRYTEGANGSKGAVAVHIETASGNGNVGEGVSNIKMIPEKEYELTMDLKLFSPENFAALPNVTLFFMTQGVQMYKDAQCTQPDSVSNSNYQYFTISGSEAFRFNEDGKTVSGDWHNFKKTVSLTNIFNGKYVKEDEPVNVRLFIRMGANPHALDRTSDFTQEFLDRVGKLGDGRAALWMEYAIDNIGLRPASYVAEEPVEEDTALWRVSFEDNNWTKETNNVTFHNSYSKTALSTDVPSEIADTSKSSLELTYTGTTNNGGYMELVADVAKNDKKMWYNRAYEISFWAKGSQALAEYQAKNPNSMLEIITERSDKARLDRTKPMWNSFRATDAMTTEWKKYTYLYYEEMPMALGRSGENEWVTKFDLRFSYVPGIAANSPEAADYKIYLDDFTVTPLDVVYNGDLAIKEASQADYTTLWYEGATNTTTVKYAGNDTKTPAVFHAGTIETVTDFPETESKNVLKVTKDGGAPYQGIDIVNGKTYQISYWAKADDAESVGQPINLILDRDLQGEVLNSSNPTYPAVPKWKGYYLEPKEAADVVLNTAGYDGYGAPTGETGSVPFYMYGGVIGNQHHVPGVLEPGNCEETLVYDDFYDRMFSKNTQEGEEPTAWAFQYYDGTQWQNTNDKAEITSERTLNDEWTLYTMEYTWNYPGKHYRMPKLTFKADANYSLTDIKIEEIEGEDPNAKSEFRVENLTAASSKTILSTADSISLTWDVTTVSGPEVTEAEGKSLVKVYAKNGENLALIGTARADKAGQTEIKASGEMFGKTLVFEVIPVDTKGNYGTGATAEFSGRIASAITSELKLNFDKTSADWSVNITTDNVTGTASAYIAMYNQNNKLVAISEEPISYASGETAKSGNVKIPSAVTEVKLFVWDEALKPMTTEKNISLMAVNSDPFKGDSEINVVFLGDSIYAGAGAEPQTERWVNKVGQWFINTYGKNGVKVNPHYKGVGGTTTDYSLVRIIRDVVDLKPDMVFVSQTCNDGGDTDTIRNLESVVRTLMALDNPPYIVITRTTNRGFSQTNGTGQQVADFYGLPLIDDLEAFKKATNGTGVAIADLFISDGVHPSNAGYKVIADEIIKCMETGRYYHRPLARQDKLKENSGAIAEMNFIPATSSSIQTTGTWTRGGDYLHTEEVGATLTINFTGDIFAFEYGLHNDAGNIEVRVDGNLVKTFDVHYNGQTGYQRVCKTNSVLFDLDYGEHEVELKMVPGPNSSGGNIKNRFINFMTGSWVQE